MEKDEGKVVINIGTAYNVNPSATVVNNTFNISSGREAAAAVKEALGDKPVVDTSVIRKEILEYVSRVRPLLEDAAKNTYMKIWEDILDLPEVAGRVYDAGKQWGTNFNRNLVANILYHLRTRKIYAMVYKDNYNAAALARALEGNEEHSVKHALRDEPPMDVREAMDRMMKKKY